MSINTIPANDRRELFTASNGQTVFPFDFPIYASTDLSVVRTRAGLPTALVLGTDYTVTGAGTQPGGSVTLTIGAVAGDVILIDSAMPTGRTSSFSDGGDLPAAGLNGEYNRIFIVLQQQERDGRRAIGFAANEPTQNGTLPAPVSRSNALVGFDAAGVLTMVPRATVGGGSFQQVGVGAVVRTMQDELAERITPRQFGAAGDGVADDTAALNAAATEAASRLAWLVIPAGIYRTTGTVTVLEPVRGVLMEGEIVCAATTGPALALGSNGTTRNRNKIYRGLRVRRASQSDWTDETRIGIQIFNQDASHIEIVQAEGFTIGVQTIGDGAARGFEDCTLILGRLVDNKIGLDVRANVPTAYNNSVRYIGGHFACSSATNVTEPRFGVRFSRGDTTSPNQSNNLQNAHNFFAPAFELQNQNGTVDAIPFLTEVNSRSVIARGVRLEGNSQAVARHTAGAQDHIYEIAFASNGSIIGPLGDAYLLTIDYTSTATRAGGSVIALHQAAATVATKLIAELDNVRAAAFQQAPGIVGFDKLTCLSSNVGPAWVTATAYVVGNERSFDGELYNCIIDHTSNASFAVDLAAARWAVLANWTVPQTLTGLAFPGLSLITLAADRVEMPTSRALGFVVRCDVCKDFLVGFDGANLRPTIMLFDAAENVLGSTSRPLLSNQTLIYSAASRWWQASADSADATLTRLQRVTVPDNAAFAIIGVASSVPAGVLRSLRLYVPAIHHPPLLYSAGRAWGSREIIGVSAAYDPASIAAGATLNFNVTCTGARPGDFADASFSIATTLPFLAQVSANDQVNVRIWNPTAAAVDLAAGDVTTRAVKRRL